MNSKGTLACATNIIFAFVAAHTPSLEAQPDVLLADDGEPRELVSIPSVRDAGDPAVVTTGSRTGVDVSLDDSAMMPSDVTVGIMLEVVNVATALLPLVIELAWSWVERFGVPVKLLP